MEPNKVYYCWKERGDDGRLYIPWADPFRYESPFDYLFDSVEDANQGKIDFGAEDEDFVLCTIEVREVR